MVKCLALALVLVMITLPDGAVLAQVPPQRIAVLDFHDSSTGHATPEEVLYLSNLVRGVARRVLPAERYLLMTRENMQEMLPQGRTLADCVGDCAVETGRKLGVDYVVTGEVTAFGGQIRVTVNMHGMQTGNMVDQIRVGATNVLGVEKDLEDQATALLLKLRVLAGGEAAGLEPGGEENKAPSELWSASGPTRMVVSFTSEPAGAIVEVDGQPLGETPCRRALAYGVYQVGFKKIRYLAHLQSLEVLAGEPVRVNAVLAPDFGWLTVESDPEGLAVTVDGEDWGFAPVQAREIGTGAHEIWVGATGYHAESHSVLISRGERSSLRVAPVPRNGGLTIVAVDALGNATEARVFVDGHNVGQVYHPLTVVQGRHDVAVEGDAGVWRGEVEVVEKQMREVSVRLLPAYSEMEFVAIPAGNFTMGSPLHEVGRGTDEAQRGVSIMRPFRMASTEVTQAQYQRVVGTNPSRTRGDVLPVVRVTWLDAVLFCNKLSAREGLVPAYRISAGDVTWDQSASGYRLPTEAEWEYACRSGTTTAYNTGGSGGDLELAGWFSGNSSDQCHPVAMKNANTWGLYDMHGNVWEWCWDWYGVEGGSGRVIRGGSANRDALHCRAAEREKYDPSASSDFLGFRVVTNAPH